MAKGLKEITIGINFLTEKDLNSEKTMKKIYDFLIKSKFMKAENIKQYHIIIKEHT